MLIQGKLHWLEGGTLNSKQDLGYEMPEYYNHSSRYM